MKKKPLVKLGLVILIIGFVLSTMGTQCPWAKDDNVISGSSGIFLNAPSGLTANTVSPSQIDLAWTDNSDNEDGFKIERSPDGVTYTQIDTVGPDIIVYSNTGLTTATTYYYRIYAYNSAGNSAYSNSAGATTSWVISTIDNSGGQGETYNISLAVDSNDKVHICYVDYNAFNDLKYAANISGSWVITPLDNVDMETDPAMTLDKNDKVHISYHDDSLNDLYYGNNITGTWVHTTVDESGNAGRYSDIAVDTNNKVHISYRYGSFLKYATNITGTWVTTMVDDTTDVRYRSSIATDSNNKVHISYLDYTNKDLKYATNITGTWVTDTIDGDTDIDGYHSSITIDSNSKVHISYYDGTNKDLKYATNASGSWVTAVIDSAGEVGGYTAIALDSNNKVHISYYDYISKDLKYATNVSGSWVTTTVDSAGAMGTYSSIAIDSDNKVHIAYQEIIATDGNVKYATNK